MRAGLRWQAAAALSGFLGALLVLGLWAVGRSLSLRRRRHRAPLVVLAEGPDGFDGGELVPGGRLWLLDGGLAVRRRAGRVWARGLGRWVCLSQGESHVPLTTACGTVQVSVCRRPWLPPDQVSLRSGMADGRAVCPRAGRSSFDRVGPWA